MNTESAVITAICENKDISTVMSGNIDEVFTSHRDVWEGLKSIAPANARSAGGFDSSDRSRS